MISSKPCEQHDWHRMLCQTLGQAFWSVFQNYVAHRKGVVADDDFAHYADVRLSGPGLLVLPGITYQIPI